MCILKNDIQGNNIFATCNVYFTQMRNIVMLKIHTFVLIYTEIYATTFSINEIYFQRLINSENNLLLFFFFGGI